MMIINKSLELLQFYGFQKIILSLMEKCRQLKNAATVAAGEGGGIGETFRGDVSRRIGLERIIKHSLWQAAYQHQQ